MANTAEQQKLLDSLSRSGWTVVGTPQPSTETINGPYDVKSGTTPQVQKWPGAEVWIINDGKGHNQTITVKPRTAAVGDTVPWPVDGSGKPIPPAGAEVYEVLDPPKDMPAASTASTGYTNQFDVTINGKSVRYGTPPGGGAPVPVPGVPGGDTSTSKSAGTVVDIKNNTAGSPNFGKNEKHVLGPDGVLGPSVGLSASQDNDKAYSSTITLRNPDGTSHIWGLKADGSGRDDLGPAGTQPAIYSSIITVKDANGENREMGVKADGSGQVDLGKSGTQNSAYVSFQDIKADDNTNHTYGIKADGTKVDLGKSPTQANTYVSYQDIRDPKDGQNHTYGIGANGQKTDLGLSSSQPTRTVLNTGTGPAIAQQDPTTGALTFTPNPNASTADVGAKVSALKNAAAQEQARLKGKIGADYTADQANADFNSWWSANVDPYIPQLQQQQYTDQQKLLQTKQAQDLAVHTAAEQAGQDAVANARAGVENAVGPDFGAHFAQGLGVVSSGKGNLNYGANDFTYQIPDYASIRTNAMKGVAESLAHISPAAAGEAGMPMPEMPKGLDVNAALNKSNYSITLPDGTRIETGGGASAPGAAAAPTATVAAPPAPNWSRADQWIGNNNTTPGLTGTTAPTVPKAPLSPGYDLSGIYVPYTYAPPQPTV